jgi:MFS superfamily sulfate permease-like transporter
VTILGIVLTDLLVGIALGMAVGVFQILYENLKTSYFLTMHEEGEKIVIELSEHVTFLNKGAVLQFLEGIEPGHEVTIDASRSVFVHPDVVEIIENFAASDKHKDDKIEIIGLTPDKSSYGKVTSADLAFIVNRLFP